MKKLVIILSVVTLGAVRAMAQQGTFDFANKSSSPILIATGTDAASLAAATIIGTNPTSESLGAGPGQVNVELFIALNGTVPQFASGNVAPPVNFFLAGTTATYGGTVSIGQGTFNGGNPYPIPSSVDGGAFTMGTEVECDFFAFTQNGNFAGLSALGTGVFLGGGSYLPSETFGTETGQIGGWTLTPVPEPSVVAFSSLVVATLLFFRCRK